KGLAAIRRRLALRLIDHDANHFRFGRARKRKGGHKRPKRAPGDLTLAGESHRSSFATHLFSLVRQARARLYTRPRRGDALFSSFGRAFESSLAQMPHPWHVVITRAALARGICFSLLLERMATGCARLSCPPNAARRQAYLFAAGFGVESGVTWLTSFIDG